MSAIVYMFHVLNIPSHLVARISKLNTHFAEYGIKYGFTTQNVPSRTGTFYPSLGVGL